MEKGLKQSQSVSPRVACQRAPPPPLPHPPRPTHLRSRGPTACAARVVPMSRADTRGAASASAASLALSISLRASGRGGMQGLERVRPWELGRVLLPLF